MVLLIRQHDVPVQTALIVFNFRRNFYVEKAAHAYSFSRGDSGWRDSVQALISDESVMHLDDLVLRRTSLWENPDWTMRNTAALCACFAWGDERCAHEIAQLRRQLELKSAIQM